MRIGIVCFPTYGGSGIIATELALVLASKHEVHLISYDQPVRLEETDFAFHKVDSSNTIFSKPSPVATLWL